MSIGILKDCKLTEIVGTTGRDIVAESRAVYQARQQAEQRQEAERRKAYEAANRDSAILTFDHWLDNVYYSGEFADSIYPVIRHIANEIFERRVYEVVLRGSIGWGKSVLARLIQKYCLYVLTTYATPHKAFTRRMVETDPIAMINMNVTAEKAKSSYFDSFRRSIYGTGYFQDKCALKKGLINRVELVDKSILCHYAGASKHSAESENLVFAALDEINLYEQVEKSRRSEHGDKYDEAAIVDAAVTHRQESRFIEPDGTFPLPVKKILLCKETYPDSYIARRCKELKDKGFDKVDGNGCQQAMIVWLANWESRPRHHYLSKALPAEDQWFWIRTATRNMPAGIIEDKRRASEERKRIRKLEEERADTDMVPELIKVPTLGGKNIEKAQANIDDFIRDVCGRPTEAIDMYLKDRSLLARAKEMRVEGKPWPWVARPQKKTRGADVIPEDVVQHPFTNEMTDLNDGVVLLKRRLVRAFEQTGITGEQYVAHRPIVAPGAPRFIHLDMGLSSDAAGLAMVAIPGMKEVTRWDDDQDASVPVLAPWIWPDLIMRFVPPQQGQIRFSAIKSLVRELVRLGFRVVAATADGYQSADFLQWTQEQYDMDSDVLSLDRTPEGYNALQRALFERRLPLYEHTWLESEIRTLERKRGKRSVSGKTIHYEYIDHTPRTTKDCSDALAGAAWNAERKASEYTHAPTVQAPIHTEVETEAQVKHREQRGLREAMQDGRLEDVFDMTGGFGDGTW